MRFVRRTARGDTVSLTPLLIALALVIVLALGSWGALSVKSAMTARKFPPKNYASLPTMTFTLGGGSGRIVDVSALLEIDKGVDPKFTDAYLSRIADQMSDRLRDVDVSQLSGAEGAQLMKSTIADVVGHEVRPVRIREVLLEQMVVR